ncbi:DUF1905 domain-containing protein [Sphingopyxis sp. L1A2A]|uniref:DUF1905 domain-containing protein n=1 Tax=Sphingopyxis sp. L1A2A TaxID=2502247 RepID=UPI0010F6345D|nr:DUF1905 domain-containing protein [Sphingopyxis sp. L1A2A]
MRLAFDAEIIEWRGPPPYLFAAVPDDLVGEVRYAAREASYGWGMVPVTAQIGASAFTTSLFRRGDTYVVPIKVAVQRAEGIGLGDRVAITLQVSGIIRR